MTLQEAEETVRRACYPEPKQREDGSLYYDEPTTEQLIAALDRTRLHRAIKALGAAQTKVYGDAAAWLAEKESAAAAIQVGDIVTLKSGGPKMTVSQVDDNVTCSWFDYNANGHAALSRGFFAAKSLVAA